MRNREEVEELLNKRKIRLPLEGVLLDNILEVLLDIRELLTPPKQHHEFESILDLGLERESNGK